MNENDKRGFLDEATWGDLISLNINGLVATAAVYEWWHGASLWALVASVWCIGAIFSQWLTVIRRAELKKLFKLIECAYEQMFFHGDAAEMSKSLQRTAQEARAIKLTWGIE